MEPLLHVNEHVFDTAQRPKGTDPDLDAIFRAFLNDNYVNSFPGMAVKSNSSTPLIRKHKCSTSASVPAKKNHGYTQSAYLHPCVLKSKQLNDMQHFHHDRPVRRQITNETYLRRLYMPPDSVTCLFPSISSKLLALRTATRSRRAQIQLSDLNQEFIMTDSTGQSWSVTCNCSMSSTGVLHCRLIGGWSRFCRDKNVSVQDEVVFVRGHGRPADITVYIDHCRDHS